jgi:hypothetical protein
VRGESGPILLALAQRRNADREGREAIVEIGAEGAPRTAGSRSRFGRRDHPSVDLPRHVVAETQDLSLLQHAQELDLHRRAHLADLVEEDGSAAGDLEETGAIAVGIGERSAPVAEQLALQEGLGQGRAVERDERELGPRALGVDAARDQLLACPRLALEKDRRAASAPRFR